MRVQDRLTAFNNINCHNVGQVQELPASYVEQGMSDALEYNISRKTNFVTSTLSVYKDLEDGSIFNFVALNNKIQGNNSNFTGIATFQYSSGHNRGLVEITLWIEGKKSKGVTINSGHKEFLIQTGYDYTNMANLHFRDKENSLIKIRKKSRFDFRKYPRF